MSETTISPAQTRQTEAIRIAFERQQQHQYLVARTSAGERIAKLWRLHDTMLRYTDQINEAMKADFRKGSNEVGITEIGVVNSEIRHTIRHLQSWMTPKRVGTPLMLIGTRSEIRYEPKGVCLIISPWNFPFNLTFAPLVSAVAAGNCAILKPSEHTPHSAALITKIVRECFPPEEVEIFEGEADVAQELLKLPFNHIFFTGSPEVGKLVMRAAAEHLTSVTLELGGKSPVIVDETADIDHAAAKIIWLKCMNAGQICISPDYVLVHDSVFEKLVQKMQEKIGQFYGKTAAERKQTPDYCRMVTTRHFNRVKGLLDDALAKGGKLACGGDTDESERFIDPAVLTHVPEDAKIWVEEIFGPLLPVRSYSTLEGAITYINRHERPLAMYIMSAKKRNIEQILKGTRNGGVTVNDCGPHFYNSDLPFGGVNNSGIGKCHGEAGFLEFSNQRGVTYQNRIFPHTNIFLPPYKSKLADLMLVGVKRWF